jgi:hypothetical protein
VRYIVTIKDLSGMTRLIDSPWAPFGMNRVYVCPQCGTSWATWFNPDDGAETRQWHSLHRTCPDHQFGLWDRDYPGSIISVVEDIVVLPTNVLRRELFLTAPAVADETALSENPSNDTAEQS